ncbi:alpha/beta hydrolase family protein [Kytococcus sp. Marseille-QA3725]
MSQNTEEIAAREDEVIARLVAEAPAPGVDIGTAATGQPGPSGDPLVVETFGDEPHATPVVLVHGGFWRPTIDRTHLRAAAVVLGKHGHRVALPEYRRVLGDPRVSLTDLLAVDDLLAAAGWYDGPARPIWVGHSAGGTLALLRAMQSDRPAVPVVSLAGVTDLPRGHAEQLGKGAVTDWMGGGPEDLPELYAELDPQGGWTGRGTPHARLLHGQQDATVPAAYSADHPALHRIVPGAHHADLVDPASPHWHHVHTAMLQAHGSLWQDLHRS